ncbi:MAG: sigma-70 family RNA polymerase sigma factor [Planctomycetales bacterium]|nr:sigma-70 family RNA polymerase sigma factor [Planctomycetales bacterium]
MSTSHSQFTRGSLLSRIRADDAAAWSDLMDLYSPLVAFWCRQRGVADSEINDALQEVFFAVARSIDKYEPPGESGSFRAWLWTIARHKIIDLLRRSARAPMVRGGSTAYESYRQIPESVDSSDNSERTEFAKVISRALEQVRSEFEPRSWQAFYRATVDSIPVATVAIELDMTPATVRQHRSRILRRLRQQLGEQS